MSDFPSKVKCVVIGAGIVGNAVVYHLAKLGWTNMLQIDKGPFPNPGGSTGHASNFIFPVDHGKEMAQLTMDSVRQYKEMGVFTRYGGIEVARTEERMEELRRRMSSAKSWGVEAQMVTVDEILEMVPFIDRDIIIGGFYTPDVGVVDSLRAGTIMREWARDNGHLTLAPNTEVRDIVVKDGQVVGIETDKGYVEAEYVVIATGCWSPKLAKMAGATIPLTPAVHQMVSAGPLPQLSGDHIYPIVRDMDTFCYERQDGTHMEVGSYAHRAILMDAEDIPSIEESPLSPTELPLTQDDFDPQLEQAMELMPELLGTDDAQISYAINGLLSLTPDGYPLIGETLEVKKLWSAAAIWIKEGPGAGRMVAEWMVRGWPDVDPHHSNIARFTDVQRTRQHVKARTDEGFNKTYGIVHPREQWNSNRNLKVTPFYAREVALGAEFFETHGWERPQWYNSNQHLVERYADQISMREHEWDARWWSPIINAEHLNMRENCAMVDLGAFAIFDVSGAGAKSYMQKIAMANMNFKIGRSAYTPILAQNGGFLADLTIMRLGRNHYRIITGGGDEGRDQQWFRQNLPEDGSVVLTNLTSAFCTIGVWGPNARDMVQSVTRQDLSNEAFPYGATQEVIINGIKCRMFRISYVGELGWEIYCPTENGLKLWDTLAEAGEAFGCAPAGIGVYGNTGRIEKGYRLMGAELETHYTPFEAGLARPKIKKADFIGKEAIIKAAGEPVATHMCTLSIDDHTSASGIKRYPQGGEPITTPDGARIVDSHDRGSYITTAGSSPSTGKFLVMGYLPPEHAVVGKKLAVQYMMELYSATVEVVGSTPYFDPTNARMKG
ncbi:MAG: GcvT family protein [Candidatus Promineifilaceae bacterium]